MNLLLNKKIIRKAFLLFTLFISLIAKGQDFIWAASTTEFGLSSGYNDIRSIVTDSKGNIYSTGSFSYSGNSILKLDKNKNFIWVKQLYSVWMTGGLGKSIILDKNENIIITGIASGLQIDLNPDPFVDYIINNPTGQTGSYIIKLDSDGNFIFGNFYPGAYADESTLDNDGNIITTGVSGGTNVDFDAGSGVYNLNTKREDIFILKNNSNGAFVWAKNIGGNRYDYPISLVCDKLNNIILKGNFENNISFLNTNYISDYNCNFICKIDPDGQELWFKQLGTMGGLGSNEDKSVKIDNQNNIYFNTSYSNTFTPNFNTKDITFTANSTDSILFKLDENGEYIWHNSIYGNERQETYSLDLDNNQNIYLIAQITGDTFINNNCNQVFPNSNPGLLLKFTQTGDFINFKNIVGGGFSIDCDFENNIFIGGGFSGNLDFDPSPSNSIFMNSSYSDGFNLKLAPCTSAIPEGDANQFFCSSNIPTIADLKPCSEIVDWYDSANSTLPISKNTLLIDGHVYYASYHESCTEDIRLAVTISFTEAPQKPIVSNLNFCKSDNAKLSDIVISGQNIKWYNSLNGGSILPNTTILVDNITYYATQTVNGCESTRTPLTLSINNVPTPITISPQTFCIQNNTTLNDIAITAQNIKWYDELTAGALLPNTTPLQNGITYYASQTINGCESERIPVTINIQNTFAPTGNTNQTFCTGQTPTIADILVTGSSIKWYDTANSGSLLAETTNLQNGKTYYASQTINNCESPRFGITVSVVNTPNAPTANGNQAFCKSGNPKLNNIQISGQNLKWYETNSSVASLSNTTLLENNKTYFASQTIGCESDRTGVLIQINAATLPTGSNNQQFCINENATTANINITGTAIKWYVSDTNETIFPETALLQNDIYYATQTLNNCESDRFPITVKVQDIQSPIADSPQIFCIQKNAKISDIDITGQNIKWFENISSTGNLPESTLLKNGVTYYASQIVNNCESDRIPIIIEILTATTSDCINFIDELPFPKFFTPNNDGFNDTWTIDFSYLAPNSTIILFDRYGKLIKELIINTSWDGTYLNQPLPSTDYWFVVTRLNGAEFKSHFSLKR